MERKYTEYLRTDLNKRVSIRIVLLFSFILALGCMSTSLKPGNPINTESPNLLFIIVDQMRYDALSIAGNPIVKTPNLDKLARQGAYFINAYTPVAVCGPARSSILTGTTINTHGVNTNDKTYYYDDSPRQGLWRRIRRFFGVLCNGFDDGH